MAKQDENRSVLIFGGAGFIGANLARCLLLETDARVHIFDNLSRRGVQHNLEQLKQAAKSGRLRITIGDVRNAAAVQRATKDATEIYQFAAQVAVTTSIADPRCDFETNSVGTFNVLEGARLSGNRPFVLFTSTNKVYGEMLKEPLKRASTRYAYADRKAVCEDQPLDFHSPYGCTACRLSFFVCHASRARCSTGTKIRAGLPTFYIPRCVERLSLSMATDGKCATCSMSETWFAPSRLFVHRYQKPLDRSTT
jgi:nucleoside-diphosphate-sugar epimerase